MSWKQIVNPNTGIVGESGLCLRYVDDVYSAPHGVPSAINSWQLAVGRGTAHPGDRNVPDISVPLYFSWKTDGHVVAKVPGQGLYSVNFHLGGHRVFDSIEAVERALPGSYLGWAEEVDTKRVVTFEPDAPVDGSLNKAHGTATVTTDVLNVRNEPDTNGAVIVTYTRGQTFNYDGYIDAGGHRWLSYVSYGGTRRYVAQNSPGESYVSGGV